MNATPADPAVVPDHSSLVRGHQSFRGLSVEKNLLSPYTMYTVDLDQLGLFISDSSPEAFNMAFEALFKPKPQALTA